MRSIFTTGSKGSGYTIHNALDSDYFNIIVSHELGHQFGGYHVQSSSNCRSSAGLQEVEPGSGSTIMGYAGICPPNVQNRPDDYFNYVDIRDIIQWTRNDSSCAELITTGNNDPTVNAGNNYTIPKSTAFILEGTASDIDSSNNLTYCWEENDPENPYSSDYPSSTRVLGPMYRSKLPISEPIRYMPQLSDVLSGNLTPTWEVTPSVSRTLDFVLTVRDNALLGAKTASDEMTVTIDDNFNPFRVTSQNTAENWNVGDTKTITWDTANTTNSPINATNVDIFLSVDGGYTYPYTIASNIANDGSESIVIPEISSSTTEGRFMVKASNNIFFAVNETNINIQSSEFILKFDDYTKTVCIPNIVKFNFTYKTFLGFSEVTNFSAGGIPTGVNVSFNPSSALADGTQVEVIVSNTTAFPLGINQFNVIGTSTNVTKQAVLNLSTYSNSIAEPQLSLPSNNQFNVDTNTTFSWNSNNNAENYSIEIATDNLFSSIIDSSTINDNNYISNNLEYNTHYFWRVKATNSCGTSLFSNTFNFTTFCKPPSNINITNITASSVDVSWTETGNASSWEIEIVNQGVTPTGSGTVVSVNSHTINNLNSSENYDIYLRSLCSASNSSSWVGPVSFSTLSDFCNGDRFYDSGGPNGNYSNNENITTVISLNGADIVQAAFLSFSIESGWDYLYIHDGSDTNAPLIGTYSGSNIPPVIRSSQGNDLTFYFSSDGSVTYSGWEVEISCITVTCPAPSNLASSNLSANSFNLSWTSNGSETNWEIEYGTVGFTNGNGTTVSATSNPFTLNGLTPVTNYDIYVRANCGTTPGTDDSLWVGPISIETPCGKFTAPYFYDVEQQTSGIVEDCWTSNPPTHTGNYYWLPRYSYQYDTQTGPYQAKSGNLFFASNTYASAGDVTELYTPFIDIASLNVPVLDFYTFMHGSNVGSLHVDILDNGSWTTDVLVINGEQQTDARDLWQEQLVPLSTFGDTIQVRFRAIAGGYNLNEIDIDDISVIEMPSCPNPTNFEVSNITASSVDLNWTSNGNETNWEIEYGTVGFTNGNGTTVSATSNPFTLNGLTPVTNYDIYVRANCGTTPGTDDSLWVGPISIETPCGKFTAPYFYDVEQQTSGIVEDCWTSNPPTHTGNYYWLPRYSYQYDTQTGPYQAKSGNLFFASNTYASAGDVTELYTPFIDIASLNVPVLDFYTFMHGSNVGSLHVDILDNGSWTTDVLVINGEQQTDARDLWQEQLVPLSTFGDTIQVRFRAIAGGYNLNEIDIDDISVIEMPSCPNPTNFEVSNITASSVDLNWTSNGNETNWEIEYGTIGFTNGNGTTVNATTNPFILSNLNSQTNYDIYLRANCGTTPGTDDSLWVGPISAQTLGNYCNGDHFYDSGGANGNYQNNENKTTVIAPLFGDYVTVNFLEFNLEGCCDRLTIYDGPDVTAPSLGYFSGSNLPGTFTSTHTTGALTFHFSSDGSITRSGWNAEVTCVSISCPPPTNAIVSNITATQVTIDWLIGGTENSWEIEYGYGNFNQGNGTTIQTSNNSQILTNLAAGTGYSYYLRANCGTSPGDNDSQWIGPFNFTTSCGVVSAPLYENFSGFSRPNCWEEFGFEPWNFNTYADFEASTAGDHTPSRTTNYAWIDGSPPSGNSHMSRLRTPWLDISNLADPAMSFSLFSVNTLDNFHNTFKVVVYDFNGARVELLMVQQSTDGWKTYVLDFSNLAITDVIQIEFVVLENSPGFSEFNDILIDEIKVNERYLLNATSNTISDFKYYPNPVKKLLTIESSEQITLVLIYSILGQKIYSLKPESIFKFDVDVSNLPNGTYMVKALSDNKLHNFKIIIDAE